MRPTRPRDDSGFSLPELLIVVLILGVLAAIAIPQFLGQREYAYDATVKSDLRNALLVAWTHAADAHPDPQMPQTWDELVDAGHKPSDGAAPADGATVVWDPDGPCLSIAHAAAPDRPWRIRQDPSEIDQATCTGTPAD